MKQSLKQKQIPAQQSSDRPSNVLQNASQAACLELQQMQQFSEQIAQPIWLLKQQQRYVNQAFRQLLETDHLHPEAALWIAQIHPNQVENFQQLWQQSQQQQHAFQSIIRLKQPDYTYHTTLVQVSYSSNATDAYQCMVQFIDLESEFRVIEQLQHQVESRNYMLDASIDCIKLLNPDGRVIHMNQAGCLALGVPPNETQFGMRWLNLLPESIRAAGKIALNEAVQGKTSRFRGKSQLENQSIAYWDNILTPIFDQQGEIKEILCVSRDISLQHQTETKLQQIIEQDDLTGLLNRRAFTRIFKTHVKQAHDKQQ